MSKDDSSRGTGTLSKLKLETHIGTDPRGEYFEGRYGQPPRCIVAWALSASEVSTCAAKWEVSRKLRSCPHSLPVTGLVKHKERTLVVLDRQDASTAWEWRAEDNRGGEQECLQIVLAIADALAFADQAGITHGNLHPGNVLILRNGQPLVGGFGLARTDVALAAVGQVALPTACYVAPELHDPSAAPNSVSDIYSLGGILHFLLAGAAPFSGAGGALVTAQRSENYSLSKSIRASLSQRVSALLRKLLSGTPESRYRDYGSLLSEIRSLIGAEPEITPAKRDAVAGSQRRGAEAVIAVPAGATSPVAPAEMLPQAKPDNAPSVRKPLSRIVAAATKPSPALSESSTDVALQLRQSRENGRIQKWEQSLSDVAKAVTRGEISLDKVEFRRRASDGFKPLTECSELRPLLVDTGPAKEADPPESTMVLKRLSSSDMGTAESSDRRPRRKPWKPDKLLASLRPWQPLMMAAAFAVLVLNVIAIGAKALSPPPPAAAPPVQVVVPSVPASPVVVPVPESKPSSQERRGFIAKTFKDSAGIEHRYVVFVPYQEADLKNPPVILFLNGVGENGTDGVIHVRKNVGLPIWEKQRQFPFVMVFPQCLKDDFSWRANGDSALIAMQILRQVQSDYRTDPDRIYMTGLSSGGNGVLDIASVAPDYFAAIAPICAASFYGTKSKNLDELARTFVETNLPVWGFYNSGDGQSAGLNRQLQWSLLLAGGDPIFTEYPRGGHDTWEYAYRDPGLFAWFLEHRRNDDRRKAPMRPLVPPVAGKDDVMLSATFIQSGEVIKGISPSDGLGVLKLSPEPTRVALHGEFRTVRGPGWQLGFGVGNSTWRVEFRNPNDGGSGLVRGDGTWVAKFDPLAERAMVWSGWTDFRLDVAEGVISLWVNGRPALTFAISGPQQLGDLSLEVPAGGNELQLRYLRVGGPTLAPMKTIQTAGPLP